MLSKFFIDRPVLAWVIAILTVILGLIVLPSLKLSRFPDIAPPTISISLSYPGASAETLENSVAQVVEQQMTGLDNLLYFNTTVNSEGNVNVRFSFDQSVNPDVAQMQVQNRFDMAMSKLPDEVQQNGVRIRKVSEDVLQNIAFYTKDGSLTQEDIGMFEKVREMLAKQLNIKPEVIKPESDVVKDLGADSLDIIEMLMTLEDEYGVTIPDDQINQVKTVRQVAELIEKCKN